MSSEPDEILEYAREVTVRNLNDRLMATLISLRPYQVR